MYVYRYINILGPIVFPDLRQGCQLRGPIPPVRAVDEHGHAPLQFVHYKRGTLHDLRDKRDGAMLRFQWKKKHSRQLFLDCSGKSGKGPRRFLITSMFDEAMDPEE